MKKSIYLFGLTLMMFLSVLFTPSVSAVRTDCSAPSLFGIFPAWYAGLPMSDDCKSVVGPSDATGNNMTEFVLKIVANITQSLLALVGLATIGFIVYGGFLYMTTQGEVSRLESAKKTIQSAVIGLIIALLAYWAIGLIKSYIINPGP